MNDIFDVRVSVAEHEAKRFLRKLQDYKKSDKHSSNKESAAMKRASMDLTRSLADVRRSRYED